MEAWHQKLHNNTTPDDIPICQAYLAFLETNGDMSAYWRVLSDAGITRQRLESFDRPIPMEPDWFEGKRDAQIRDFQNYLGILKAVHSGERKGRGPCINRRSCSTFLIDLEMYKARPFFHPKL